MGLNTVGQAHDREGTIFFRLPQDRDRTSSSESLATLRAAHSLPTGPQDKLMCQDILSLDGARTMGSRQQKIRKMIHL
jgi:hypothetical protein